MSDSSTIGSSAELRAARPTTGPVAPRQDPPLPGQRAWAPRLAAIAAGLCYAMAAALPALLGDLSPRALSPLGVIALGLGLLTLSHLQRDRFVLRAISLVVFPALVALGAALSRAALPSPAAMLLIVLSWCIYLALALRLTRVASAWPQSDKSITDPLPPGHLRRRLTRALYAGALTLGLVGLAVVVPLLGSEAIYVARWGEASRSARVLVAVVAGCLAVGAVAAIVAPGLRRRSAAPTQTLRRANLRALGYLLAGAAFAAVYWIIVHSAGRTP